MLFAGIVSRMAENDGEKVARLERDLAELKREMTSFKEKCRNGFYAFEAKPLLQNFEENLALYVYPRGREFGKTAIFPSLMNWLDIRRNTRQGMDARNRWLQVQDELQLSQNHQGVLTKLRNLLPYINQQLPVEEWNPVSFTEQEKRCIEDLHHLSERLAEWIYEEENDREQIEAL